MLPAAQSVGIKEEDSGVEEDLSPPQILNRSPFDAALDDADSYTSKQVTLLFTFKITRAYFNSFMIF